jgi:hypothetical protein
MKTLNNHTQLLIGKNIAVAIATGTVVTPTTLADGEIAVVDQNGKALSTATLAGVNEIYLVQGQGSTKPLIKSAAITKAGVFSYLAKAYSAGAEEIEYLGYNAVTNAGSFTVTSSNPYQIKSVLISNTMEFADKQMYVEANYVSDSSATQVEIVTGLAKNFILNSEKFVNVPFKVERVSNGTFSASDNIVTVTNKSKNIVFTTAAEHSTGTPYAVGDTIRLGVTGSAGAATQPIYVITAVNGLTLTLDVAYQGTSGAIPAADSGVVTVITSYGIKLTGLPKTFQEGILKYEKNKWKSLLLGAGSTPTAITTNPAEGTGRYEQVAEEEWFYQLAEGFADTMTIQIPPVSFRKNVSLTGTYSIVDIRWKTNEGTAIVANSTAFKQIRLAFDKQGGAIANWQANKAVTGIVTVLDAWLSTFAAQVASL